MRIARFYTLGEITTGLAHEINQPLFTINNYIQASLHLLRSEKIPKEDLLRALEQVAFQSERAGEIVRSIRRFVKKDAPKRDWININDVIRESLKIVNADIVQNDIKVILDLDDNITHTHCDRVQIEQVLMNLIRNSIEAMVEVYDREHQLVIQSASKQNIQVSVTDNGPGIAPDILDKVFYPFVTSKVTGMGFGLSISKSIVEEWGGQLICHNNETNGSTFSFTIPIK